HLQHVYWRHMEPERFTLQPTRQERRELTHAVRFGYQMMDWLVGRFRRLGGDAAAVLFCTALRSQACVPYETEGGKVRHRPRSFDALLAFAGIKPPYRVAPVMSEQFRVYFEEERDAAVAAKQLLALRVDECDALDVRQERAALFVGCKIRDLPPDAMLTAATSDRRTRIFDLFYRLEWLKSGMHHPDGMRCIRPQAHQHPGH